MTDKIYAVFYDGESGYEIIGAFHTKFDAIKCLEAKKEEILVLKHLTMEQIEQGNDYDWCDDNDHFCLLDFYGQREELTILEKDIPRKEFIAIEFYTCFNGNRERHTQRIYLDYIEPTYEDIWDCWWEEDDHPYDYEFCADKNNDGTFSTRNMRINIYADKYEDIPFAHGSDIRVVYDTRNND